MNAEGLINVGQAVAHGHSRLVKNLRTNQQGRVIDVEDDALTVLVEQGTEVWPCGDCVENNPD